jgi:hypothetical protein
MQPACGWGVRWLTGIEAGVSAQLTRRYQCISSDPALYCCGLLPLVLFSGGAGEQKYCVDKRAACRGFT